MILQRLAEHYDRMEASGVDLPRLGSSRQKISFCIVLEASGELNSIQDMRTLQGKSLQPRSLIVRGQGKPPGSGLNPCFLWDNAEYLLGWSKEEARKPRALEAFFASRKMYLAAEAAIAVPAFSAVCRFMERWTPEQSAAYADVLLECATHFGVFRIAGQQHFVHEQAKKLAVGDDGEENHGMCLVSGTLESLAQLHEPAIKGVADAQSSGAKLVSFNKDAFTSYGKDQSLNAPVGEVTVFKYANALNYLLDKPERRISLGDATVVFWADHAEPVLDECLASLFGGVSSSPASTPEEDEERVRQARLLLDQVRNGTRVAKLSVKDAEPTRYYILGLSPNASRLSVRLWMEAEAPELERRLGEHLRDMQLETGLEERPLSLRGISNATGRYAAGGKSKFDTKAVSPQLVGELARAVLIGSPYPRLLLATMVRRIRSDQYVGYERVSAIKACLNRDTRLRGETNESLGTQARAKEMPVALDPEHPDVAYRCGRVFALLEKAQIAALGKELNSTIKDRFFAAASATPSLVFPRLFRLNTHHLAKLTPGSRGFYLNAFGEVMRDPFAFPRQFSLEEQGRFFIGYFQERQYRSKDESTSTQEPTASDE